MENCPPELLHEIFGYLGPSEHKVVREVCHSWTALVDHTIGLKVRLNERELGNRDFVAGVKVISLAIEWMRRKSCFFLDVASALQSVTCVSPPSESWFFGELLHLPHLAHLTLAGDFFVLQDLSASSHLLEPRTQPLHKLKSLSVEIAGRKWEDLHQPTAGGVLPKIEEKMAERIGKNLWLILQVVRSNQLEEVKIRDDFPRWITSRIQEHQWWGQVFAEFLRFHQYSLKKLTLKKAFCPYPEDPFTTDNLGIPLRLEHLSLSISGADLGTFHYWRALIQSQQHLRSLELHLSGAFWRRFPIVPFLKRSRALLERLDLTLEYDAERVNPETESRFDFAAIASCRELRGLKLGPCGYLAPTLNFHLVPRLLQNLTALHLTFIDISSQELESITECESLKLLYLQCLIQIVDRAITSPVTVPLVRRILHMRTLDALALDLITLQGSHNIVMEMALGLYGKTFKGSGFFFPYDLEDELIISSCSLRRPAVPVEALPPVHLTDRLAGDEPGEEYERKSHVRAVEDGFGEDARCGRGHAEDDGGSQTPAQAHNHRTPAQGARRRPGPPRCISRFCTTALLDLHEDLMAAEALDVWEGYVDGTLLFPALAHFLPWAHQVPYQAGLEDICTCSLPLEEERERPGESLPAPALSGGVGREGEGAGRGMELETEQQREGGGEREGRGSWGMMAAVALEECLSLHSDTLTGVRSKVSKDWFTQTDISRQDSNDVMTQYEKRHPRSLWQEEAVEVRSCDSESQTDLRALNLCECCEKARTWMDISTQKDFRATDGSTQHEVVDSSTQNISHLFVHIKDVESQPHNELLSLDKETQKETKLMDVATQEGSPLSLLQEKETEVLLLPLRTKAQVWTETDKVLGRDQSTSSVLHEITKMLVNSADTASQTHSQESQWVASGATGASGSASQRTVTVVTSEFAGSVKPVVSSMTSQTSAVDQREEGREAVSSQVPRHQCCSADGETDVLGLVSQDSSSQTDMHFPVSFKDQSYQTGGIRRHSETFTARLCDGSAQSVLTADKEVETDVGKGVGPVIQTGDRGVEEADVPSSLPRLRSSCTQYEIQLSESMTQCEEVLLGSCHFHQARLGRKDGGTQYEWTQSDTESQAQSDLTLLRESRTQYDADLSSSLGAERVQSEEVEEASLQLPPTASEHEEEVDANGNVIRLRKVWENVGEERDSGSDGKSWAWTDGLSGKREDFPQAASYDSDTISVEETEEDVEREPASSESGGRGGRGGIPLTLAQVAGCRKPARSASKVRGEVGGRQMVTRTDGATLDAGSHDKHLAGDTLHTYPPSPRQRKSKRHVGGRGAGGSGGPGGPGGPGRGTNRKFCTIT